MVVHSTSNVTLENNVCARVVGHIFYEEWGNETGVTLDHNLGLGAMSNNFNINAPTPELRKRLVDNYWWVGDNLVKQTDYNYNGFNIPDTDKQQNPTRGGCGIAQGDGTLKLLDPGRSKPAWAVNPDGRIARRANLFRAAERLLDRQSDHRDDQQLDRRMPGHGPRVLVCPAQINVTNPANPLEKEVDVKFQPEGLFQNNRAHGCYSGLYAEGEDGVLSDQLFPHKPASKRRAGDG